MIRALRPILLLLTALLVVTGAVACSSDSDGNDVKDGETQTTAGTNEAVDPSGATIIDVRTPEEFAAGHLPDAVLIDIQNPSFTDEISKLDKGGRYLVYCRSGNRSAAAVAQMRGAGFTDVTDIGGLDAASAATDLTIVTG